MIYADVNFLPDDNIHTVRKNTEAKLPARNLV